MLRLGGLFASYVLACQGIQSPRGFDTHDNHYALLFGYIR